MSPSWRCSLPSSTLLLLQAEQEVGDMADPGADMEVAVVEVF
jgi:hypothetical protein